MECLILDNLSDTGDVLHAWEVMEVLSSVAGNLQGWSLN